MHLATLYFNPRSMKARLFNSFLLFSLFGIALSFFGMLYEGIVVIPKMLDASRERMQFWQSFYRVINPIMFYIPLVPVATLLLLFLYVNTRKQTDEFKKQLGWAAITQVLSLVLTFYIVTQVNLKLYFSDIGKYAGIIPFKTVLVNILSVIRLVFSAIALFLLFRSYVDTQQRGTI